MTVEEHEARLARDAELQKQHKPLVDPWQDRLLTERDELAERITKLGGFLDKMPPDDLTGVQINLMWHQRLHMERYLDVLIQRIRLAGIE